MVLQKMIYKIVDDEYDDDKDGRLKAGGQTIKYLAK